MRFFRKIWLQVLLWVCVPAISGAAIYLLLSPTGYWLTTIFPQMKPLKPLYEWEVYNLPDGLWAFTLMYSMLLIWSNRISGASIFWIAITIFMGPVFEILQGLEKIPGTFDILDGIFELGGSFLAIAINQAVNYRRKR